jgi:hypothetical protein
MPRGVKVHSSGIRIGSFRKIDNPCKVLLDAESQTTGVMAFSSALGNGNEPVS